MLQYFLDFNENIRFSKTLTEYQEHPYPIQKTIIVFLDPSRKACNICRIFMEQPGNIPIFNFPRTLFWNIPRNFMGKFFQTYWEYLKGMVHEYSMNTYLPDGIQTIT